MRIGVIGSAGGSAFEAALQIWRASAASSPADSFFVLTDRSCGLEAVCRRHGLSMQRIEEPDNTRFSRQAADVFGADGNIDFVVLYYSRLVTAELFDAHVAYNLHPGMLPAFPGIGAVRKAMRHGARFLGATLHRVDETVDGGPIIAQACQPIRPADSLEYLEKCSYLQKVYLTLLLFEMANVGELATRGRPHSTPSAARGCTDRFSPALVWRELIDGFQNLYEAEMREVSSPTSSV